MPVVALYSPLVFSTPVLSPLSVGPSLPRLHQEKTPTITRFVAFFSSPFYLFLFSSLFSALLLSFFFLSFFPSSLPLRISPMSLYIRLQTKFYVYFIRTYTRSTPFVYTYTFVRPDVRIVINTTLASPYNARRFCVPARSLLAYTYPPCDCARPGPLIKFVSPNVHGVTASIRCLLFFFPSPIPSTFRIRLWFPVCPHPPRVFPSFFSRDTCSSPIGSVVRLAARGDPFRFASLRDELP